MRFHYVSSEIPLVPMDEDTAIHYIKKLDSIQERIMRYAGWYLKFDYQEVVHHRMYSDACRDKWEVLNEMAELGYFNSGFAAHDWYSRNSGIGEYRLREVEEQPEIRFHSLGQTVIPRALLMP